MPKPVRLRHRAVEDIEAQLDHYHRDAGDDVALRFIGSLEQAVEHLGRHPQTGSLRCSYELEIPGVRSWPLQDFPHLVFYVDGPDHVDVWRLLHSARDIPSWFADPDPT